MKTSTIEVIDPDEINLETLAALINQANIECGIDTESEEIYILNSFDYSVYLQVKQEPRVICVACYLGVKRDSSPSDLAMFVKRLNDTDDHLHCNFGFNKSDKDGRVQIGGFAIYSYFYGLHLESLLYLIQKLTDEFIDGCFKDVDGTFVVYHEEDGGIVNLNNAD